MNQEESEQNAVDGMTKGADSTCKVMAKIRCIARFKPICQDYDETSAYFLAHSLQTYVTVYKNDDKMHRVPRKIKVR